MPPFKASNPVIILEPNTASYLWLNNGLSCFGISSGGYWPSPCDNAIKSKLFFIAYVNPIFTLPPKP